MCDLTSELYISKKNQYFCTTSKNGPIQAFEMQKRHTTLFFACNPRWMEHFDKLLVLWNLLLPVVRNGSLPPSAPSHLLFEPYYHHWNFISSYAQTSILTPMKMKMDSKLSLNLQFIALRLKIVWGQAPWYKDIVWVVICCHIMTFRQYVAFGVFSIHLSLWKTYHSSGRKMVCVLNGSVDEP